MRNLIRISAFICIQLLASCSKPAPERKVGFIESSKVFNEYLGTKERQNELEGLVKKQNDVIDSLKQSITLLEAKGVTTEAQIDQLNKSKLIYNRVLQEFANNNNESQNQLTNQLWVQINQYISEYGTKNGYAFIYGANGQGNLMYADSTFNISDELIEFINIKYSGEE